MFDRFATWSLLALALSFGRLAAAQPAPSKATEHTQRAGTPIALPELLQVAIRQSPAVTRAIVDIDIANADALAAQGLDDFTVTANAAATRSQTLETVGTRGLLEQDSYTAGLGLARGLPTGGVISANAAGQVTNETFRPDGAASVADTGVIATVSATLRHPLLRGFGVRVARADRRRAEVAHDVATLQETEEALNLSRDVIVAYWQLALARQVIEIRAEGLKLAEEQLRITQTAVKTGAVSPTETLEAEQAIAVREFALLQAQVAVSQQSLDLRRKAGLEISAKQIDLEPTTPLQTPTETFDVDATIARAIAANPLLALIESKGRGAQIEVEVADDSTLPRLDLHASIAAAGYSSTTNKALQQIGSFDNPGFAVGLEFEHPLGASAARGARDRAVAQKQRIKIDYEDARRQISVDVAHAIDLLRTAQKRIDVADRAIGLARRTLEIQQTRFINGKATNFDIVLRQDELQQVRLNRAQAVGDALAARTAIEALTGDLLADYHIRIASQ